MASKYPDKDHSTPTQRFADVSEEPCRMLRPIQGYDKMPLVSLEEAVESLAKYVPDVKRMAYIAKAKCQESPTDVMSIDESASIMLYCLEWEPTEQCFYLALNTALRTEDRNILKPWFLYLRLIMGALIQLPWTDHLVFRGVKRDMRAEYRAGETIEWWGFSSCTGTMSALENEQFLGSSGLRTLFTIQCRNAIDIGPYSCFKKENEILLPPARQFQVISCLSQGPDLHMIHLKEIDPPFPLIDLVPRVSVCQCFQLICYGIISFFVLDSSNDLYSGFDHFV
jgi:hypothetical protein